jgi:hypothetical protein
VRGQDRKCHGNQQSASIPLVGKLRSQSSRRLGELQRKDIEFAIGNQYIRTKIPSEPPIVSQRLRANGRGSEALGQDLNPKRAASYIRN